MTGRMSQRWFDSTGVASAEPEIELDGDNDQPFEGSPAKPSALRKWMKRLKLSLLFSYWLIFTVLLMFKEEHEPFTMMVPIPVNGKAYYPIDDTVTDGVRIELTGPFTVPKDSHFFDPGMEGTQLNMTMEYVKFIGENNSVADDVVVVSDTEIHALVGEEWLRTVELSRKRKVLELNTSGSPPVGSTLSAVFNHNATIPVLLLVSHDVKYLPTPQSVLYAALILVNFYFLLATDIVNKLLAAFITCSLCVGVMASINSRPGLPEMLSVVNVETLFEIFGLTIIAKKLYQTGILDHLAVRLYKISNGHIWPMLNWLCLITFLSAIVLSNIMLMFFVTPILLRICEIMLLNPTPVIICVIIAANIGTALTPTIDEVNYRIFADHTVGHGQFGFRVYMLHVVPGVLLAILQSYCHMRIQYSNSNAMRYKDGDDVERLRRAIRVWKRTAKAMHVYTQKEKQVRDTVLSQVGAFKARFGRLGKMPKPTPDFEENLKRLEHEYPIRDQRLLMHCGITIMFVIVFFSLSNFARLTSLTNGWVALVGAILLLLLSDKHHIEGLLSRIEWSTILFIIAMYLIATNLDAMGIPQIMIPFSMSILQKVEKDHQLMVAILIVVWVAGLSSAFLGKLTTTPIMISVVQKIYLHETLDIPLAPLVWAAALGICFGGNGTIISNFSNLLCVNLAENRGYLFYFCDYFKIGFPIMIGNLVIASVYLIVAHCVFEWH